MAEQGTAMVTEKRPDLIDRKDLIKAVEKKQFAIADNTHPYEAIRIQGKYFREVVDNAPTVDAVEVVRCKDCAFYRETEDWDGNNYYACHKRAAVLIMQMKPDDFCSYGERRTDD